MEYRRLRSSDDYYTIDRMNSTATYGVEDYHCLLPDNYDKNYFIYKRTNAIREVTVEEFHRWDYTGYIFFDKNKYDKNHIENWIKWIKVNRLNCNYLNKPFPPFDPEKIKVRNYAIYKV